MNTSKNHTNRPENKNIVFFTILYSLSCLLFLQNVAVYNGLWHVLIMTPHSISELNFIFSIGKIWSFRTVTKACFGYNGQKKSPFTSFSSYTTRYYFHFDFFSSQLQIAIMHVGWYLLLRSRDMLWCPHVRWMQQHVVDCAPFYLRPLSCSLKWTFHLKILVTQVLRNSMFRICWSKKTLPFILTTQHTFILLSFSFTSELHCARY